MNLIAGANIVIPTKTLQVEIKSVGLDLSALDFSAYCLSQGNLKVRGDDDMIFYGQLSNQSRTINLIQAQHIVFDIELPRLDSDVGKIAICATMADERQRFSALNYLDIQVKDQFKHYASGKIYGAERSEAALIIAEVYRYKSDWKFRLVDQGFNGGLKPLAENFGVEIAEETEQSDVVSSSPIVDIEQSIVQKGLRNFFDQPFKAIDKRKNLKAFQVLVIPILSKYYLTQEDKQAIQNFCLQRNLAIQEACQFIATEVKIFLVTAAATHAKPQLLEWAAFLHSSEGTIQEIIQIVDQSSKIQFTRMLKKALSDGELNQHEIEELNGFIQRNQLNRNDLMQTAQQEIANFFHFNLAVFVSNEKILPQEEQLIQNLCRYLMPNQQLVDEINQTMQMVKRIESIKKGLVEPIQTNDIIVKNSEIVFLQQKNVRIRVSQKEVLQGDLFITNERIILKANKAIETLISNIISVDLISDHIEIIAKTKKGSGRFYIGKDANIVNAYIDQAIRRFHRQLDLQQTTGTSRHIPAHVKNSVWVRCQGRCVECASTMYLEFDHIIPFSKGGSNSENNLQILCRSCNLEKSNRI